MPRNQKFVGSYTTQVTGTPVNLSGTLNIPESDADPITYTYPGSNGPQALSPTSHGQTITFILTVGNVAYTFTGNFSEGNGKKNYANGVTWAGNPDGTNGSWTAST